MPRVAKLIITPLVMLTCLGVVAYAVYWGYNEIRKGTGPKAADVCVATDVGTELTGDDVTIRIYNSGAPDGEGKRTSTYLRYYQFHVLSVKNGEVEIGSPVEVVGSSATDPEVLLVAGFFKDPVIRGDGRTDHIVDLSLGPGYTVDLRVEEPAESLPVTGPVCLPQLASATETPGITVTSSATPEPEETPVDDEGDLPESTETAEGESESEE
ncbi:MAG: LytR C-terminal domain-containing protein [Propionibacteriaceae bacterium]|jgi:hypothetical protein|nr:LytR C-terminal domain-containing protein [Propionibacteriaceae bacterium]